ncbi:sensor histidine kinase [Methanoregula sp.]|uniref:sensor histidine kinase n=1 Tax=Methanoregula sp. TaxID=2052170 RepID=UPI003BB10017
MKILVLEDSPSDMEMLRELLEDQDKRAFDVIHVERLSAAIPYLSKGNIDIIISDLGLPDSQGLDTLKTLKEHSSEIPIVVLTGLDNERIGIEALKEGAQDYLVKGQMSSQSLSRSLRYAIERNAIETERKKMELQITQQLKEKEMLLKEIHHRVKNNMQVISSLLNLQSQTAKDDATRLLFKESQNRIRSIALVHEQLYRSDNLNQIEYGGYLKKMFATLFDSYGADPRRIYMLIDVPTVKITIEKAVPCSLIVNEQLSNSLKHAFPPDAFPKDRKGEIRIGFMLDTAHGNYVLDYRDNGVGMPESLDPQKTGTLGMQLIYGLAQQLGGSVVLERGNGVHYTITFPAKELKKE